jgi:hypothetical protein
MLPARMSDPTRAVQMVTVPPVVVVSHKPPQIAESASCLDTTWPSAPNSWSSEHLLPLSDHKFMDAAPALYAIRINGHLGATALTAFPRRCHTLKALRPFSPDTSIGRRSMAYSLRSRLSDSTS